MRLTEHDLKQLDEEYLSQLSPAQLLRLSEKLLNDLREARDRLNEGPQNSSRPSGSYAPWEQAGFSEEKKRSEEIDGSEENQNKETETPDVEPQGDKEKGTVETGGKRRAGKQPGAKGFGRRVEIAVTGEEYHRAIACNGCGARFGEEAPFKATTGRYVLDIEKQEAGLQVSHVKHIYGERGCECGHVTQTKPGRCAAEQGWTVGLTEWHLVGPTLSALIICLSMRMRMSRPRIREFLQDWLSISLSTGCINQCITEGGRASAPLEEALIAEVQKSDLIYADETGWKENGRPVWLWVLRTATATLYIIGRRSWDVIADIMAQFGGWLMTDGYGQYRKYGKRLRCLAHLIRKARGLAESCHPEAADFGEKVLENIGHFIKGIYAARGDPSLDLLETFSQELAQLKKLCQRHRDHLHHKTKKLARELLNDWEAIWTVLAHPELPITNNLAEQSLRHWVIARKISYGTRNPQGSRAFTLLASVIDTCRQRGVSPWPYIAAVIAARRKGDPPPPLPLPLP